MSDLEKGQQDLIDTLLAQNAALKAELAAEESAFRETLCKTLLERDWYKASAEKLALAIREYLVGIGCVNNHVMLDRLYKAEAAYAKTSASDAGTTEEK